MCKRSLFLNVVPVPGTCISLDIRANLFIAGHTSHPVGPPAPEIIIEVNKDNGDQLFCCCRSLGVSDPNPVASWALTSPPLAHTSL